jgi:hypothetical protein
MDAGGMVYHALNRANFRSALFRHDGHYQDFLDLVEETRKRYLTPFSPSAALASDTAGQNTEAQDRADVPQQVQDAIKQGEPPNGEYSFLSGKSCPDCKYYPKQVQEAVNAHEEQHKKDEHTVKGFFMLFTKKGRAELEVRAFKAELEVENRQIGNLQSIVGPRSPGEEQTLKILENMRDQAMGVVQNPATYINSQ